MFLAQADPLFASIFQGSCDREGRLHLQRILRNVLSCVTSLQEVEKNSRTFLTRWPGRVVQDTGFEIWCPPPVPPICS